VSHLIWLAAVLAGAAGVTAAVTRPAVTAAAPRLGAVVEVLTLTAIGLAPPLLLARTGAVAARAALTARRAGPRGRALAAAVPRRAPGGVTASVVPSSRPAAWCGGLRHPQVVVTTGLLGLLGPAEPEAVLAHEAAHIRLGHPRILLTGAVIGRSYRWLPPARLACDRLRRDLEAAADDEAATTAGAGPLLSALAKVAFAATPQAAAGARPHRVRRPGGPALPDPPPAGTPGPQPPQHVVARPGRSGPDRRAGRGGLPAAARRARMAGPDRLPGRLRLPGLASCLDPHHPHAGHGPGPRQPRALTGGSRPAETGHGHGGNGPPGRGNRSAPAPACRPEAHVTNQDQLRPLN
jgi:Zn-dependent protease with chaperone function